MNCINTYGIVLENHPVRRLANGSLVVSMRIADPSGSIIFTIMNAEIQDLFEPGDIIKIKNGFTNIYRGMLNLSCGRQGEFMKSGDFMLVYSETPNMSEFNSEYAAMERARKPSPPPEGECRFWWENEIVSEVHSTCAGTHIMRLNRIVGQVIRDGLKVFDQVCLRTNARLPGIKQEVLHINGRTQALVGTIGGDHRRMVVQGELIFA
ncbi:hypothetical protein Y032_0010g932 [Ancylostoma ceylanicum]|uniref:Single-stranded DNA binding protein Ssb-like OB fold domain-containing protein n=1 Tax=Ancylostoma ceylanicum TaxID=53326 RepID=A0A016VHF2_9BILA|nr:hypothetical protein Y032_0010g932 [Ancylostoma ceylanicum]